MVGLVVLGVVLLAYALYFLVIKKWQWPDHPRLGAAMFVGATGGRPFASER